VPFPKPVQGLVIRYSYLWRTEHLRGQEEGIKDRPCAVILVTTAKDGREVVTVLPVTHSPPSNDTPAVEIPSETKQRLGLDSERSWVVLAESNRFLWPGPDLRPVPSDNLGSVAYGILPYNLAVEIQDKFAALVAARLSRVVPRTE
jgi:hypothetical protein